MADDSEQADPFLSVVRYMGDILLGCSTFALDRAIEGKLSVEDIIDLAQRISPALRSDDGEIAREVRARLDDTIAEHLSQAHLAAKMRGAP